MKAKPPSVRVLTAALLGLLFVPVGVGANASAATSTDETLNVSMTAYNAVPGQTDADPLTTASGAYSDPDVVAARSQNLASELPFGTVIAIEAATSSPSCGYGKVGQLIGLRVIADTMNSKERSKVDILLPQKEVSGTGKTYNPAITLGVCKNVTIKVVGHVAISDMPTTQDELSATIDSSSELAVAK